MSVQRGASVGAAALERFAVFGYAHTTLGDIARKVGVTEARLQDEFISKEALVAVLTAPLLDRLVVLVGVAGDADSHDPDAAAEILGCYFGVLVDHRQTLDVLLGDPTASACPAVGRLRAALTTLRDELADPAGGQEGRIVAAAALGAVEHAVADLSDVELLVGRAVVVSTAVTILVTGAP